MIDYRRYIEARRWRARQRRKEAIVELMAWITVVGLFGWLLLYWGERLGYLS